MERRRFETLLVVVRIVLDAVAINAAFVLAWWIRFASGWLEAPLGQQPLEPYLRALIVITLVWLLVFRACDMYRREAPRSAPDEFYRVLIAATLTMLGLMAMSFLYRGHEFSRLTILIAWVLSVLLAAGLRGGLNAWVRHYQKSRARRRRVAVISLPHAWSPPGGEETESWADEVEVVALVEVDAAEPSGQLPDQVAEVVRLVETQAIEEVIVSRAALPQAQLLSLLQTCERHGVELGLLPDAVDVMIRRGLPTEVAGRPVVKLRESPLSGWNAFVKRLMDIFFSVIGLILFAPLMLVITVLIRLSSPGPAIYKQERMSLNGQTFTLYKFRTMRPDAEAETGPVWTKPGDPRITPLGHWLRRTSFDELPQLFNVLLGHMSLVGPRPERPYFVNQFQQEVPRYMDRHQVKAGITGWAQINGQRGGESSIEERTRYDLFYVENWSLLFDFQILVKTIFEVLFHKGAR